MPAEIIASAIAFLITIMVLSYLIGDNPLFRIAVHVFIGVSAGYIAAVAWWQVLWPRLVAPLLAGSTTVSLVVPLIFSGLLLMKAWPSLSRLGMPAMGVLVGAAAAVALGGAINGTLVPQIGATLAAFGPASIAAPDAFLNSVLVLTGVIASLAYFHFSARSLPDGSVRRLAVIEIMAAAGSVFIGITLGVLFAGVYSAALTALLERLHFFGTFLGIG